MFSLPGLGWVCTKNIIAFNFTYERLLGLWRLPIIFRTNVSRDLNQSFLPKDPSNELIKTRVGTGQGKMVTSSKVNGLYPGESVHVGDDRLSRLV